MFDKKAHWAHIYNNKSPLDVSWYQIEPKLSLELIQHTSIHRDEAIIDIGGGASLLVDFLKKNGFNNLSVLDISEKALITAQKRLGNLAKTMDWYEEDITEFHPPKKFALWHDRAVFHFLTAQSDRTKYLNVLKKALKPEGHVIIATFAIGGPQKCSGLDIVQYDAPKLLNELGREFNLLEERNELHTTPDNKQQKFMYFRFVRKSLF